MFPEGSAYEKGCDFRISFLHLIPLSQDQIFGKIYSTEPQHITRLVPEFNVRKVTCCNVEKATVMNNDFARLESIKKSNNQ